MLPAKRTDVALTSVFPENVWKAKKNHGLERSLKAAIPDEVYENLEKEFEAIENQ